MDDLISRTAAKAAIRSKFQSIAERCEINEVLNGVPTIDAIPVEWLNKQCEMADDRGDMEMTDAISWLIQTWQEEQEAQDE